ncbi:MAG: hypothetical protein RMK74_16865 [Myxococcales bacterium]|nr:hypothetical protein [Myxococcales bacterium]
MDVRRTRRRGAMGRVVGALTGMGLLAACGGSPAPRWVVERDLGEWRFRRYQRVLDVEFPIEGNPAVGHTAAYVRRGPRGSTWATAFVVVYERPAGLVAEVREALDSLSAYTVRVGRLEGENVWLLEGDAERWALWVSGRVLVKLGAPPGAPIPEEIAEAYTDRYPSDLDEQGRAREGAASAGPSRREREEREQEQERELPSHLREGAPR